MRIALECYECGGELKLEHSETDKVIRVHICQCVKELEIDIDGSEIVIEEKGE